MNLLTIDQLVKTFDSFSLGPLSLTVDAGCSVGLIGANGAGKTTLFRSIMGTLRHQQGRFALDGKAVNDAQQSYKATIGYVGDYTPLFENWSGEKNLKTFQPYYPNWSEQIAFETARRLNLNLKLKAKNYSTGQRTKLAIVLALASRPHLLILDEPTTGLDPVARESFSELLFEFLGDESHSLIYATHHISEIEQLVDRLVFISEGQVLRDEIKEDLTENWRRITFRSNSAPDGIPCVISSKGEPPYHELISENGEETLKFLRNAGIDTADSSRVSVEKIAIEILKCTAREISYV